MKKSFKSLIIVLIIVMCIVVLAGCQQPIKDDFNTITFHLNDGSTLTFERSDVQISETETLVIIDKYYWNNGGQRTVLQKSQIKKVIYT